MHSGELVLVFRWRERDFPVRSSVAVPQAPECQTPGVFTQGRLRRMLSGKTAVSLSMSRSIPQHSSWYLHCITQ